MRSSFPLVISGFLLPLTEAASSFPLIEIRISTLDSVPWGFIFPPVVQKDVVNSSFSLPLGLQYAFSFNQFLLFSGIPSLFSSLNFI